MRATGVDKIVFSSTCATYGIPAAGPIRESVPQLPVNSYGETKLAIQRTLHWYGEPYGKRSVPLRYFNAAGADSEGEIGELHEPETRLVPLQPTIRRRMERRSTTTFTLRIWPGSFARSGIFASGAVAPHRAQISERQGHSVRELIAAAEAVSERAIPGARLPSGQATLRCL